MIISHGTEFWRRSDIVAACDFAVIVIVVRDIGDLNFFRVVFFRFVSCQIKCFFAVYADALVPFVALLSANASYASFLVFALV